MKFLLVFLSLVSATCGACSIANEFGKQMLYLRQEIQRAAREGYDVAPVEALLDPVVWRETAAEMQTNLQAARRYCLRRARGMLLNLKLPRWARNARFVQPKNTVISPAGNVAATAAGTTWKASVTSSSEPNDPRATLDGDTVNQESYWAAPEHSGVPQTLELDFHRTVTLSRCILHWYSEQIRGTAYDLDAWDLTHNSWGALFREEDNRKQVAEYEFPPVSATRVRLTLRAVVGQDRVVMRELMLFGPETPKEATVCRPGPLEQLRPNELAYLARSWGTCFGVARPTIGCDAVDFWHERDNRAAFYIEGCLAPVSMLLMPEQRQWVTPASRAYANAYWHYGEEWWGLSGKFPGHQRWMADQVELLARLGFDVGFIDSAISAEENLTEQDFRVNENAITRGGWTELQSVLRKHPQLVLGLNNFGATFPDDEVLKYRTVAVGEMSENSGDPAFPAMVHRWARHNYSAPVWAWQTTSGSFPDLAYAAYVSQGIQVVTDMRQSERVVRFVDTYGDLLRYPANEAFIRQDRARVTAGPDTLRTALMFRHISPNRGLLILHCYNWSRTPASNLQVDVDVAGLPLQTPRQATCIAPGHEPVSLNAEVKDGSVQLRIPECQDWSIVVLGAPLPPQTTARDQKVAAGGSFELSLAVRGQRPEDRLSLLMPQGWKARLLRRGPTGGSWQEITFRVAVPRECAEGMYGITPAWSNGARGRCSALPVEVQVVTPIQFRWDPPHLFAPSKTPQALRLEVLNNTEKRVDVETIVSFPRGWQARAAVRCVKGLVPRARAGMDVVVQPPGAACGLWGFRDVPVEVRWSAQVGGGSLELPLRAFPAPIKLLPGDVLGIFRQNDCHPWPFPDMELQPGGLDAALKSLGSSSTVLWVDETNAPALDPTQTRSFLERGGGLVVTAAKLPDPTVLPVEVGAPVTKRDLLLSPHRLTDGVRQLRSRFPGEHKAISIAPKVWGETIATWGDGTPAIVISQDPERRVAYVASRLPGDYRFGDGGIGPGKELWPENLWLITALYHELFRWAASARLERPARIRERGKTR